ncbi:MAG: hypothetical protein Q7U04_02630, partial [Bacteriovorax sp.]|nr:hypothetical protein [Bacteriovorax sp.]
GNETFKIVVPTIDKAVKYHLEIFSDSLGKTLTYSADSALPEILWNTNRSGIYYIKYKVYDNKQRESEFSSFSKLIFPISPLSDW